MSATDPLVEFRLDKVEDAILRLTATTEQLARIDERLVENRAAMDRAFKELKEHREAIGLIQRELPEIRRATGWVYVAAAAIVGAALTLVWRAATLQPRAPDALPAAIVQRSEGERR